MEPYENTKENPDLATLFYAGDHPELLRLTVDRQTPAIPFKRIHFIIGSLAFMGRLEEAEIFFSRHAKEMNEEVRCAARFFIGIGLTRHSFYERARALFFENLKVGRNSRSPRIRFFCFQGLGFYRFFCGRFAHAGRAARKAYTSVLTTKFLWGKVVALDLMGHSLVETGETALGIAKLEQALSLALGLGEGGIPQTLRISIALTRTQFGLVSMTRAIRELENLEQSLTDKDSYSRASILLELGRAYRLVGRLRDARNALNRSCLFIYASRNRRQAVILNLRYAMLSFAQGEYEQALILLGSTRNDLVPGVDSALEVEVSGLEIKILETLGLTHGLDAMIERNRFLTFYTAKSTAIRMWRRRSESATFIRARGEDPLGDLIDQAKPSVEISGEVVDAILQKGCLSLLPKILSIRENEQSIYLGLLPGSLLIFARGNVVWVPKGMSSTLEKVVYHLDSVEIASKKDLIETVWSYEYRPLDHDGLIYSTISRLKALLGSYADWIEVSDRGYALNSQVRMKVKTSEGAEKKIPREIAVAFDDRLNHRQILLLRELRKREFLAVRESMKLFRVSEITANRDLTELFKQGLVTRVGRGRATRYRLSQANGSF